MDQVLAFSKRYAGWIAAGVVGTVIAVAAVVAYRAMPDEEDVTGALLEGEEPTEETTES